MYIYIFRVCVFICSRRKKYYAGATWCRISMLGGAVHHQLRHAWSTMTLLRQPTAPFYLLPFCLYYSILPFCDHLSCSKLSRLQERVTASWGVLTGKSSSLLKKHKRRHRQCNKALSRIARIAPHPPSHWKIDDYMIIIWWLCVIWTFACTRCFACLAFLCMCVHI